MDDPFQLPPDPKSLGKTVFDRATDLGEQIAGGASGLYYKARIGIHNFSQSRHGREIAETVDWSRRNPGKTAGIAAVGLLGAMFVNQYIFNPVQNYTRSLVSGIVGGNQIEQVEEQAPGQPPQAAPQPAPAQPAPARPAPPPTAAPTPVNPTPTQPRPAQAIPAPARPAPLEQIITYTTTAEEVGVNSVWRFSEKVHEWTSSGMLPEDFKDQIPAGATYQLGIIGKDGKFQAFPSGIVDTVRAVQDAPANTDQTYGLNNDNRRDFLVVGPGISNKDRLPQNTREAVNTRAEAIHNSFDILPTQAELYGELCKELPGEGILANVTCEPTLLQGYDGLADIVQPGSKFTIAARAIVPQAAAQQGSTDDNARTWRHPVTGASITLDELAASYDDWKARQEARETAPQADSIAYATTPAQPSLVDRLKSTVQTAGEYKTAAQQKFSNAFRAATGAISAAASNLGYAAIPSSEEVLSLGVDHRMPKGPKLTERIQSAKNKLYETARSVGEDLAAATANVQYALKPSSESFAEMDLSEHRRIMNNDMHDYGNNFTALNLEKGGQYDQPQPTMTERIGSSIKSFFGKAKAATFEQSQQLYRATTQVASEAWDTTTGLAQMAYEGLPGQKRFEKLNLKGEEEQKEYAFDRAERNAESLFRYRTECINRLNPIFGS